MLKAVKIDWKQFNDVVVHKQPVQTESLMHNSD